MKLLVVALLAYSATAVPFLAGSTRDLTLLPRPQSVEVSSGCTHTGVGSSCSSNDGTGDTIEQDNGGSAGQGGQGGQGSQPGQGVQGGGSGGGGSGGSAPVHWIFPGVCPFQQGCTNSQGSFVAQGQATNNPAFTSSSSGGAGSGGSSSGGPANATTGSLGVSASNSTSTGQDGGVIVTGGGSSTSPPGNSGGSGGSSGGSSCTANAPNSSCNGSGVTSGTCEIDAVPQSTTTFQVTCLGDTYIVLASSFNTCQAGSSGSTWACPTSYCSKNGAAGTASGCSSTGS